jgi:hypothetical protein
MVISFEKQDDIRLLKPFQGKDSELDNGARINISIDDLITLFEKRCVKTSYKHTNSSHEVKLLAPFSLKTNFNLSQITGPSKEPIGMKIIAK